MAPALTSPVDVLGLELVVGEADVVRDAEVVGARLVVDGALDGAVSESELQAASRPPTASDAAPSRRNCRRLIRLLIRRPR
jgi:hypothetical protein